MIKFCQKILLCATSWVKKERRQVFFLVFVHLFHWVVSQKTPDVKTQTILFQDAKMIAFIAEDFKRLKVTVWIEWAHWSPCRLILSSWGRVHDPFIHTSHDLQQFIAGVSEQQAFCSVCGCFFFYNISYMAKRFNQSWATQFINCLRESNLCCKLFRASSSRLQLWRKLIGSLGNYNGDGNANGNN